MGIEAAHGGAGVTAAGVVEQGEDEVIEHGEDEGSAAGGDFAGVFAEGSVPAPVVAVFDMPVVTQELEQAGWRSLLWGEAGDAADKGMGGSALLGDLAFDQKDLSYAGPLVSEIEVEFTGGADAPDFDASVAGIDGCGGLFWEPRIGLATEQEADVVVEAWLVALDDKQIVAALAADQAAETPLGMQRIGGDDEILAVAVTQVAEQCGGFAAFAGNRQQRLHVRPGHIVDSQRALHPAFLRRFGCGL